VCRKRTRPNRDVTNRGKAENPVAYLQGNRLSTDIVLRFSSLYQACKGKGKRFPVLLTEHHAMKAYWGSGGVASRILDLGTRWRWVVSFTTRLLYPQGKSPRYPLSRRLGGPQSRSGLGGEEKNSQPLLGLELPDHPVRSPALYNWTIPDPLPREYQDLNSLSLRMPSSKSSLPLSCHWILNSLIS
jgi:hypothetical protein